MTVTIHNILYYIMRFRYFFLSKFHNPYTRSNNNVEYMYTYTLTTTFSYILGTLLRDTRRELSALYTRDVIYSFSCKRPAAVFHTYNIIYT